MRRSRLGGLEKPAGPRQHSRGRPRDPLSHRAGSGPFSRAGGFAQTLFFQVTWIFKLTISPLTIVAVWYCVLWFLVDHDHQRLAAEKAKRYATKKRLKVAPPTPGEILIAIFLPALGLLLTMGDSGFPELALKVVGCQWYWSYEYCDCQASPPPVGLALRRSGVCSIKIEPAQNAKLYELFFNRTKGFQGTAVTVNQTVEWTAAGCGLSK
jgi:heme/copper-type cytochrome/quinol oxidase subunit 2